MGRAAAVRRRARTEEPGRLGPPLGCVHGPSDGVAACRHPSRRRHRAGTDSLRQRPRTGARPLPRPSARRSRRGAFDPRQLPGAARAAVPPGECRARSPPSMPARACPLRSPMAASRCGRSHRRRGPPRRQRNAPGADPSWRPALDAVLGRLHWHWHCHFIQKLEDRPESEWRNVHPAYDGLRERVFSDRTLFEAWRNGLTGLPFVDACMARARGHWLDQLPHAGDAGRRRRLPPLAALARAGASIWPGCSPTTSRASTGTRCRCSPAPPASNTVRIYNPVKQGRDHDPDGRFTHRWVPELAGVDDRLLHEPWRMDRTQQRSAGCVLGREISRAGGRPPGPPPALPASASGQPVADRHSRPRRTASRPAMAAAAPDCPPRPRLAVAATTANWDSRRRRAAKPPRRERPRRDVARRGLNARPAYSAIPLKRL